MEGICASHGNSRAFVGQVEAVLGAAPRLRLLAADVHCPDAAVAHRLLRNEGAFAAVRVRKLCFSRTQDGEAGVLALAADLPAHTCLTEVALHYAPLRTLAVLDTFVDAALELRLPSLTLFNCHVTPASAPALARLISGGALTALHVHNMGQQLLDQPAAALIADALRTNSTLTSLKLQECNFLQDAAAAALVLGALTAHRSLRTLDLSANNAYGNLAPAVGAALGALVAADAPALHELDVSASGLGDAGLGALVDALPLNTHLRTLLLAYNNCTKAFTRDRLLPAVRANTSLQYLTAVGYEEADDDRREFAHEAEALVGAHHAAAP
jgi:Ran GTPase-activating protein (RanGAP) involved in mRNA processing and transport